MVDNIHYDNSDRVEHPMTLPHLLHDAKDREERDLHSRHPLLSCPLKIILAL